MKTEVSEKYFFLGVWGWILIDKYAYIIINYKIILNYFDDLLLIYSSSAFAYLVWQPVLIERLVWCDGRVIGAEEEYIKNRSSK
jgi:hypothetical protein